MLKKAISAEFLLMTGILFAGTPLLFSSQKPAPEMPFRLGGCGGVYLYPETGLLEVEVLKQDLPVRRNTHLRAILFGPDRTVLEEKWIPPAGKGKGPGPVQSVTLRTKVLHPGVYGVNITVTGDRYGNYMSWGFRTSCKKYLIETSRGHKDARHQEPIVLRSPGAGGDVCFLPTNNAFTIQAENLARDTGFLTLYDAEGKAVQKLKVENRQARCTIPADKNRPPEPWRLQFPHYTGIVHIDGTTRWNRGSPRENLSLWTPDKNSWFNFHENRWLLTPYHRTVYLGKEEKRTLHFTITNATSSSKTVRLAIENDLEQKKYTALSSSSVTLRPLSEAALQVVCALPEAQTSRTYRLRATAHDETGFSTWSSITVKRGAPPADAPVQTPIVLKPYRHENRQFGYLPNIPVDNQVYFDPANRPFVLAADGVFRKDDGRWSKTTHATLKTEEADEQTGTTIPIRTVNTRIGFDAADGLYCLGRYGSNTYLLYSRDHGATFTAFTLPGGGRYDMESFSGHNTTDHPPALLRYRQTARDPKRIWRRINDLDLVLPEKARDGSLTICPPIAVSKKCIGISMHSGIPATIASRGDSVHITWGEATDPAKKVPGVPTFVATCSRQARTSPKAVLVGYGPPANDIHNTPCITIDSRGHLHVIIGTHGRPFKYVRSLAPDTAYGGWSKAEEFGRGLRQTYIGMVCSQDDTIHIAFRLWRYDRRYFPGGSYATLAVMQKPPDGSWSQPEIVVVSSFSEYSIFYHRLTIDRENRLFLSYDYWSTFWFYRTDHKGTRRALICSEDNGTTWQYK